MGRQPHQNTATAVPRGVWGAALSRCALPPISIILESSLREAPHHRALSCAQRDSLKGDAERANASQLSLFTKSPLSSLSDRQGRFQRPVKVPLVLVDGLPTKQGLGRPSPWKKNKRTSLSLCLSSLSLSLYLSLSSFRVGSFPPESLSCLRPVVVLPQASFFIAKRKIQKPRKSESRESGRACSSESVKLSGFRRQKAGGPGRSAGSA